MPNSVKLLKTLEAEQLRRERRTLAAVSRRDSEFRSWSEWYVPHYFTETSCRLHDHLFDRLGTFDEERNRREACLAARGYGKSVIISKAYPLYVGCEAKEVYTLLVSDSPKQSQKNLASVRTELEENPRIRADYPEVFGPGPTWNENVLKLRNGVSIEATGNGGLIRGTTHGHHRPTLILADDMDNDESVESEKQRDKSWTWFTRALMPTLAKGGNIFVCGTALHRSDTMQRLKSTPGWLFRMYAAMISEPDNDDLWAEWSQILIDQTIAYSENRDAEFVDRARAFYEDNTEAMHAGADILWPQYETLYELMIYKLRDPWGFKSEKQGIPTSSQSAEWSEKYFPDSIYFDKWPELRWKVMACDPSKGATDSSDYSAWIMLGLGHDGNLYVDADIQRRDIDRICIDGIELAKMFSPASITIESNSFEGLILSWELLYDQMPDAALVPPPLALKSRIKKTVRIRRLSPYITNFKFRYKAHSRGVDILLDQIRDFPNARYDDGPDALEMAMRTIEWTMAEAVADDKDGHAEYDCVEVV